MTSKEFRKQFVRRQVLFPGQEIIIYFELTIWAIDLPRSSVFDDLINPVALV